MVFDERMGNAVFVSHEWLARDHPDPEFRQMTVLQDALKHLLGSKGAVYPDLVTEACVPAARSIAHKDFQVRPLFIWYDFLSVPQCPSGLSRVVGNGDDSNQAKAILSIPSYVSKCQFFFALCPTIDCPFQAKVLNAATWSSRGWCRLERAVRELSADNTWILMQSSTSLEVVGTAFSFVSGSVGEGDFTIPEDRAVLAPVMKDILRHKLILCLKSGNLPAFRRHLNLQSVHMRGLGINLSESMVFEYEAALPAHQDPVAEFLYQNGLESVAQQDRSGWFPLHYAALSGNPDVVGGLLLQRADPNQRTTRPEGKLGFPPWMSALDLAMFYKHNDAAQLLIAARAQLYGGIHHPMINAAMSDNAEGLRLLCAAGGDLKRRNLFGRLDDTRGIYRFLWVISIYMYTCIRIYTHTLHVCTSLHLSLYIYIHIHMHTHTHMHIRTYIHACIHAYMYTCIHAYMHACMHTYIPTYLYIYIYILWMGIDSRTLAGSFATEHPRLRRGFRVCSRLREPGGARGDLDEEATRKTGAWQGPLRRHGCWAWNGRPAL